jgi:signal transduction histidine kinase
MTTQLVGARYRTELLLWAVRFGWAAVLVLVLGLMIENAPANLVYTRHDYQVGMATPAILTFTSPATFALWLLRVRYLLVALYGVVALLIAWHRRRDWFALLVSAALIVTAWALILRGDQTTWRYPQLFVELVPALPLIIGQLPILGLIALFFLFPDGRFIFRWHRWMALACVLVSYAFFNGDQWPAVFGAYRPFLDRWGWPIGMGLLLGSLMVALASQVYRYRRVATRVQQQQMKWVVFGLGAFLAYPLLSWPLEDLAGAWGALAAIGVELILMPLLPIAIGFSMFRYRLWDVDLLINRTLVYGGLTFFVVALYALAVGAASRVLPAGEGGLIPLMALLVAGLIIVPARRQLQRRADRWLPPSPPPIASVAGQKERQGTGSVLFRLARIGWLALAVLLVTDIALRVTEWERLVAGTAAEWLMTESLGALPGVAPAGFATYVLVIRLLVLLVFVGTATVLFWRQRQDTMALFAAYALLLTNIIGVGLGDTTRASYVVLGIAGVMLAFLLPFWFPDGRFVPRSTRWRLALGALLVIVPVAVFSAVSAQPGRFPEGGDYPAMMTAFATLLAAGVASQVYRYRRLSTPVERQQIKWVLLGFALQLTWIGWLLVWIGGLVTRLGVAEPIAALIMLHLATLAPIALPVTVGFSVLRYRLWNVDLLINRALVFGVLTVVVTLLYGLLVGAFSFLLRTGAGVFLSVAATGLIAILFQPLRQRLQRSVNRLMFGERDDPVTVLAQLGERLENVTVPGATLPTLVETIAGALKLPYVAVELVASEGTHEIVATGGTLPADGTAGECHRFPLVYQNERIGALLISPRAPGEAFGSDEARLLRNVARQAGAAVYASRLTGQLQRSREQLVTAREEERRRLRRDLHDGLGPRLATLSLKADAARNYLPRDQQTSERLLLELKEELQGAIGEIRQIAHNLRPPALDQLGLVSALREHASQTSGNGLQVVVEAPETLPPLPAAVEVAAYRIALEALTNVVRHAGARHCRVTICVNAGLRLRVRDDGRGLPAVPAVGVGLGSMRERAAELGGTLSVTSAADGGTELEAFLPFALPE